MATAAIWNSSLRKGRTIKTEVQGSKFQKYSMKIVFYILNRPEDDMCFKAYPKYRAPGNLCVITRGQGELRFSRFK